MLSVITIDGKRIVVESDPEDLPVSLEDAPGVPVGAEPTGLGDRVQDAAKLIENTVGAIAGTVLSALKGVQPDECSLEIGFAFKGEHSPIPVLVKVGGEASVKVKASWKKPSA